MEPDDVEILLVEDNPKDVELTLHALKKHKLANKIHVARDGQEALDFFFDGANVKAVKPKLVLLDLKLPKVSGLEVLQRLKGDLRTRAIPVVILTSSTTEKDMVEGYALGVNSYVRKPIDFNEFIDAAKTLGLYWLLMNNNPP
ncbi:MAG: response regulator [Thermoplasmatota archaeon]